MGRGVNRSRTRSRLAILAAFLLQVPFATAQQTNQYTERARLTNLSEIEWSALGLSRYPIKLPVPAKEHVWEHLGSVSSVNFSPDSKIAVTGSWKEGRAYSVEDGKQLYTFKPKRPFYLIIAAVTPDDKSAFTSAGDRTTPEWDLKTDEMVREWGHRKDIEDLDISPGGGRNVATTAEDRTAKLSER